MNKIKCFIVSFNRLSFLREQVNFLSRDKRMELIAIDNGSTYEPLLKYLNYPNKKFQLITPGKNFGHTVVWDAGLSKFYCANEPYIVTDPDVIPAKENWLDLLMEGLERFPDVNKVGLGLHLNDLTPNIPFVHQIIKHEESLYRKKTRDIRFDYMAVDTTLAIYRAGYHQYSVWGTDSNNWNPAVGCKSLRTSFPLGARHLSWYLTKEQLQSEEHQFYLNSLQTSTHWSQKQKLYGK